VEELERRWTDRTTRWAAALGFAAGMEVEEVAAASLEALARPGQGAAIARQELEAREELLRARYPVDLEPAER
jgi:hypothetical protein